MNIPAHTGCNQISGQIGYGGKRGFDGSLSYALTNHIALGGSMFINRQTFHDNPLPGLSSGYSLAANSTYREGQVSYFWVVDESFVLATTGGYGSGNRQIRWLENQLDAQYDRYFVQASGAWVTAPNKWVGLGLKIHYTNYRSASFQQQSLNNLLLAGSPHGMIGVDLAQTFRLPLSPMLAVTGQLGCYFSIGHVSLATTSGSMINGYNNIGMIANAGLALSLPMKRQR